MSREKAVFTVAWNPRLTAESAPTVWIVLHMVSQRRHMMHLLGLRTMEGERSILKCDISPL